MEISPVYRLLGMVNSVFKITRRLYSQTGDLSHNLIDHLVSRGLISQVSSKAATAAVESLTGVYLGADPTARSLHLGNLVPLMVLVHFYLRGHKVFPLVGAATGFVGDPSGRQTERQQMQQQEREENVKLIHSQMTKMLENGAKQGQKYGYNSTGSIHPVSNLSWWKDVSMLGFLSTYGRHIRVSQMLARDSVSQRLHSDQGIGFNEFSYQVLQAYDFYHLFKNHGVQFQLGGNDQWGNITAGIDLISRLVKPTPSPTASPIGLTVPLLTTPSGEKFGKSAGNAVFIDKELTKPYHMYQYLLKSPDSAVEGYLKLFTLIPLAEIDSIMVKHMENPELYQAQHRLAYEVTSLIHGDKIAADARLVGEIMFENKKATSNEVKTAFESQGLIKPYPGLVGESWKSLVSSVTGKSKSEAARLLKQGAVYFGTARQVVTGKNVLESDLEDGLLLVRVGKTEYHAIVPAIWTSSRKCT